MALWFLNFSTWDGVAGIYLEDLFVRPRFRRRGLARALLAALAAECLDNGYTRLSWAVLNWNADAIALYDDVGGATAARVDHLSAVRPGDWPSWPDRADRHRRPSARAAGLKSKINTASAADARGNPEGRPMRAHRQVPGHRQQQQLGEHGQPAPPALADHQRASGGQHHAADQNEPDRGAQAVDHALVGSRDPAHHQHRGHHQRGHTLHRDDESRAADGGTGLVRVAGGAVTASA